MNQANTQPPRVAQPAPPPVFGVLSGFGQSRKVNQDVAWTCVAANVPAQSVAEKGFLFVVADGMGGYAGGEVAAKLVAEGFGGAYYASAEPTVEGRVRAAIGAAHALVRAERERQPALEKMGSTLVAAIVLGGEAWVVNVGDSRGYLLRGERLEQITVDHSWVARQLAEKILTADEARNHPMRSVLLRAFGSDAAAPAPDIRKLGWLPGDRLLLCTDGVWNTVPHAQLETLLGRGAPGAAVEQILAAAHTSDDNITALIVAAPPAPKARSTRRWLAVALASAALCAGLGAAGVLLLGRLPSLGVQQAASPLPVILAPSPTPPRPTPTRIPVILPTATLVPQPTATLLGPEVSTPEPTAMSLVVAPTVDVLAPTPTLVPTPALPAIDSASLVACEAKEFDLAQGRCLSTIANLPFERPISIIRFSWRWITPPKDGQELVFRWKIGAKSDIDRCVVKNGVCGKSGEYNLTHESLLAFRGEGSIRSGTHRLQIELDKNVIGQIEVTVQ